MTVTAGAPIAVGGLGPAYWRMWTASVVSRFGDALRGPALALVAAGLTRDARAIALVVIAGQLPGLLFGLVGGALADRWDRRWSMAGSDALRCVLVAGLAVAVFTGRASVLVLVLFAFTLSAVGTLFDASSFAILPELVPVEKLAKANGRMQVGATISGGLLGGSVAGGLFVLAAALPFAVDAVTFAVAALLVLTLPRFSRSSMGAGQAKRGGLWADAVAGLRWMLRDPVLRLLAMLAALANLVIGALMAVMVLLILDVFAVPPAAYGLFTLVGAGGAIAGGLTAARIGSRFGTLPALRLVLAIQTVALAVLAVARHMVPGGAALGLFIAGTAIWNVLCSSYQQQVTPKELLGRVGAASRVVGLMSAPVGAALGGLAADRFGVVSVAAFGAALFCCIGGFGLEDPNRSPVGRAPVFRLRGRWRAAAGLPEYRSCGRRRGDRGFRLGWSGPSLRCWVWHQNPYGLS